MIILGILLLILSNAVTIRRDKSILFSRSAMTITITCLIISFSGFYMKFLDQGIGLYGGNYISTVVTHVFHIFIFIITILVLQLNSFYPRKIWTSDYSWGINNIHDTFRNLKNYILNKMSQQYKILEYPIIIMFILLGGVFLISSGDLISIFISIELQSYSLYILCALYRNSERPLSAALVYFLLGGLSSCLILLGIALLYINSGHTNFDSYYITTNISTAIQNTTGIADSLSNNQYNSINYNYSDYYKNFSLAVLSIGFLFKISAAPFHFWSPDVYDAVPTIVTTFIAIFAKISILVLLLELVHFTSDNFSITNYESNISQHIPYNISWTFTLLISSLFSLIIGSILGLTQFRVKRLLAYSTISHLGFILLALTINSVESIQAFIFYLMQYSLSNLNAFLLLIAIGYSLYFYVTNENINTLEQNTNSTFTYKQELDVSDKNNSPIQLIKEMKGYFYINHFMAVSLAITLFSFVGVPPLIGFFAKQMVLISAIDSGYMFMVFVAILTSVISACYYLVFIKEIFFDRSNYKLIPGLVTWNSHIIENINLSISPSSSDKKEESSVSFNSSETEINLDNVYLNSFLSTTISLLTLMILTFMLIPQEWLNMTTIITLIFFNC